MTRKPIKQEDPLGCGVACVAFVTGVSYKTAKSKYFKTVNSAKTTGYICKDLVKALSLSGKKYSYNYIKYKRRFQNNTIAFIKRSKRYPAGHYLAKSKFGWMDPWINFNIKDPNPKLAISGFRKRLPGRPIYVIFPTQVRVSSKT